MKLTVHKSDLVKLLSRVSPAVSDKSSVPVLKCVILRAEKGRLCARATDLMTAISTSIPAAVGKGGSAAIPLDWLFETVKTMPAGEVNVECSAADLTVHVKAAKRKAKGPFLPADDFPELAEPAKSAQAACLPSTELSSLLSQASYAQHVGDDRQHIACVRFESSGSGVMCAATDGNRFAKANRSIETGVLEESITSHAVKVAERLAADFKDADVSLSTTGGDNGYLHFVWPDLTLSVKRGEQSFCPWQKIIPATYKTEVSLPRQELIDAINAAKVASGKNESGTRGVRIDLKEGVCVVSAETAARGSAEAAIDCAYSGRNWAAGAASEFLTQALASIQDDDVLMKVSGELDPIVFVGASDPEAALAVVMPMRL